MGVPPFREMPGEQRIPHEIYYLRARKKKNKQTNKHELENQNETLKPRIFNQRQYNKVKENKTTIKISEFYERY